MNRKLKTTVILGGHGKTGRRVATKLQARGLPVRPVSRSTPIGFDWSDRSTWASALADAGQLYITYHPDLAVPGAAQHIAQISRLATEQGIERIVLLAGRGEPQVHAAEDAVRSSGATFTILECAFFAQNFDEGLLRPIDGDVVFPGGEVAEPFIDCDDIAEVAVAALIEDGHHGQTYELTGPQAITFGEACTTMSRAAGRPLRYVPVTFEKYAKLLEPHLPAEQIHFFIALFRDLLDGHNAHCADGVEQALGRRARTFQEYAEAAAGAWR